MALIDHLLIQYRQLRKHTHITRYVLNNFCACSNEDFSNHGGGVSGSTLYDTPRAVLPFVEIIRRRAAILSTNSGDGDVFKSQFIMMVRLHNTIHKEMVYVTIYRDQDSTNKCLSIGMWPSFLYMALV